MATMSRTTRSAMKILILMCLFSVGECVLPPLLLQRETSENDAITNYFNAGYKYATIISILATYHGIRISLSKLKRILRQHQLKRRKINVDENELRNAIQNELSGPGSMSGYRDMWNILRQDYGIQVPRDRVMKCLREMDPVGTRQRLHHRLKRWIYQNKGPNHAWHVDGYDKLRPYGFEIHGCIDGYSRRIMWLEVGPSNKDPKIICGYYLKCVRQIGGCPRIIRTDPGTENTLLAAVQCTFRRDATDDFAGAGAHRYGKSVFNQRIEAWWSHYKKNRSGWWLQKFKDLVDFGALDIGNDFHIKCMQFCFMDILQDDINRCARKWNDHSMRPVKNSECPHGKPNILFILPQENGTQDFKSNVPDEDIVWAESLAKLPNSKTGGDDDIFFESVLHRDGLSLPTNWDEAVKLYLHLTS